MKRQVILAALKLCGEGLLFTVLIGLAVLLIGRLSGWQTSVEYSNAFFIAGGLVIVAGASSRMAAGQERNNFQLHMEAFRDLSLSERANYVVNASSPARLVILGLWTGILLIVISAILPKLF